MQQFLSRQHSGLRRALCLCYISARKTNQRSILIKRVLRFYKEAKNSHMMHKWQTKQISWYKYPGIVVFTSERYDVYIALKNQWNTTAIHTFFGTRWVIMCQIINNQIDSIAPVWITAGLLSSFASLKPDHQFLRAILQLPCYVFNFSLWLEMRVMRVDKRFWWSTVYFYQLV